MEETLPADPLSAADSGTGRPLAGIVVVDLTRVLAGPYCTMVLSDLGAQVVKVERPEVGDDARHIGPFVEGKSAYFESINRGKRSIALDLKAADEKAIFDRLLAHADVLIENYRPGTMEKLGYGWETLSARYPRLIMASTSGFGQTGPQRGRAAYDMVVQGMGGIMSLTGHPGGPPTRVGTSVGDITAGLFTAIGIASALYERAQTGRGRRIDVSMLDCQVAILENAIARYFATGAVPGPMGARHPSITPFEAFATADAHIIIAAGNDQLFARLARTLGNPDWTEDTRFATNAARTENADALKQVIEAALAPHTTDHWLAVLDEAGVPSGPINDVAGALAEPQIAARGMVGAIDGTRLKVAGNPIKLDGVSDPHSFAPASALDGDREAILRWLDTRDTEQS
jgi:CoA:oxalate CoA-transferase